MTLATFSNPRTVQFVDTDTSGHAHFSTYIRMMEETEYAFLRSRGLSVVLQDERGTLGFPRLSAEIEVRQALRFEQTANVHLRLMEMDGKQIVYEFDIVSTDLQIAITGKFIVALCRFPADSPPYAVLIPADVENALRSS